MQFTINNYTIYTLVILLISYGIVRGYIFIRDRKIKKELRKNGRTIAREICSILIKDKVLQRRYFSAKTAKKILKIIDELPKATIVKKLVFSLNYYIRVSAKKPETLKDRSYVRKKIIYPIMQDLGVFLSQLDSEIKEIWESVPRRKRYEEQDTILIDLYSKICDTLLSTNNEHQNE